MRVSLAPLFVLLTLLVFPSTHAQEQAGLDALASDTSSAILKSSDMPTKAKRVLIVDFARMYEAPNQWGVELAREFADSLTRQTNGLIVIDRSEFLREVAQDRLLEGDDRRPDVRNCYAGELGADAVVEGFLKDIPEGTALGIKAWRVGDRKVIFEKGITLTLTSEVKALAAKPVVHPPAVPLSGKNTWVKPQHPPVADVAATPVLKCCDKGYTHPSCLYCPHPDFPPAAIAGKIQGAILLDVELDTDGFPAKISVFQGLPCGLNQSAVEAVKKWKFTPATGPEGKAVAVRQVVEVQFRLY